MIYGNCTFDARRHILAGMSGVFAWRVVVPGVMFLAGIGFEVSDFNSPELARVLWIIGTLWLGVASLTWEPISQWLPRITISAPRALRTSVVPAKPSDTRSAAPVPFKSIWIKSMVATVDLSGIWSPEPFLLLDFAVMNQSLEPITVESVVGHIAVGGVRCNANPSIEHGLRLLPDSQSLVRVRQEIASNLAGDLAMSATHLSLYGGEARVPVNLEALRWRVAHEDGQKEEIVVGREFYIVGPVRQEHSTKVLRPSDSLLHSPECYSSQMLMHENLR